MTKGEAINNFFSRIMPSYAASAVPDNVEFPYLSYDGAFDAWNGGEVSITVKMWFYTDEEKTPNAKAAELSELIGYGGAVLPCDGGYIWLKRGTPFSQPFTDAQNPNVKQRYINVSAEYLTLN